MVSRTFAFLVELLKNSEIFKQIIKLLKGGAPALRVIRAGTRLAVYRALPSPGKGSKRNAGAVGIPVPRAPILFRTLTALNMFLIVKTIVIQQDATWNMNFVNQT